MGMSSSSSKSCELNPNSTTAECACITCVRRYRLSDWRSSCPLSDGQDDGVMGSAGATAPPPHSASDATDSDTAEAPSSAAAEAVEGALAPTPPPGCSGPTRLDRVRW